MSYSIVNHRLHKDGQPVTYRQTPNMGGALKARYLVMHFTAGGYSGAVSWLTNRQAKASAHLVIGEGGEVTQLAPFNRQTWHAGRSSWRGVSGLNAHSIGIELANYGQLKKRGSSWYFGDRAMPNDRVVEARHANGGPVSGWHTYTKAQMDAAREIAQALDEAYKFDDVLGHDQIAPGRKTDPGPAFDMVGFRRAVIGNDGSNWPVKDDRSDGTTKPLTKSRTLAGAGMTSLGLLGEPVSEAARQLEPLAGMSDMIKWAFLGLTIAGVFLVIYARVSDSAKGAVK